MAMKPQDAEPEVVWDGRHDDYCWIACPHPTPPPLPEVDEYDEWLPDGGTPEWR